MYAASVMRDLSPVRWLNGVLALLLVVCAVAPSCAPPDFNFTGKDPDTELPQHCRNQVFDEGETDVDCGDECDPCALGQGCASTGDCLEGECIDSYCQDAGCSDGAITGDESDVDCGGPACKPCPPSSLCREGADCESDVCIDGTCAAPACNDLVFNGDESDIDCGGSCDQCPPGRVCREGNDVCGLDNRCIVVCVEGRADCDLNPQNSCEVNLKTDPDNCGECGADCALKHANADCSGGECIVASCKEPYLDCNGEADDGCEINGGEDIANCGACNKKCPAAQGTALCIEGKCDIDCDAGFDDCDGNAENGCEKGVLSDVNNCGACGNICPAQPGFTPYCLEGVCGETKCPDGFGNCNGNLEDGCEADLRSNVDHCNTCGNFCAAVNGTAACDERVCIVESCDPGHADCNEKYVDGCEINTDTSVEHCGECENQCEIANATPECKGGECQVKTCSGSYRDCDGNDTDCEVNIATDADHCGGCVAPTGHDCSDDFASRHANGVCVNQICEPGTCYTDYANCNTTASDGCEVALKSDDNHCGNCTTVCQDNNAANSCSSGACVIASCNTNYASCDNNSANGCEVNKLTNTSHCGGCGNVCQPTNAVPACTNGACTPNCNTNFLSCDGNGNNGCEVDKRTNDAHCGKCNNECVDAGGTNTCVASVCVPVCDGTHGDCDDSRTNGCEANITTDEANCGACGKDCVSGAAVHATNGSTCLGGTCKPECDDGWGACSNPENGCLTKLDTAAHCGACETSCSGGTPFCVNESCAARLPIVLESSTASTSALTCSNSCSNFTLALSHTIKKGQGNYRMVVIAVASTGQNQDAATPNSVSYGASGNLTLQHSSWASNRAWAGIYLVKDAQLPSAANTASTVTVAFGTADAAARAAVAIYEFSGVEQGTPVAAQIATPRGNCSTPPSDTLSIATAGAHLVSVASLFGQTSANPTGVPLPLVERMDLNASEFTGLSGQVQTASAGSHTAGWAPGSCNNSAHVLIALDPAKTP